MRHRKFTFKIGRTTAHRRADMANMTCSLLTHGQVKTTLTRAKQLRRMADKMITLGKRGTLHARRQAVSKLRQKDVVKILFDEIAPRYAERPGGYTRILKIGQRNGDAAEMCFVQLVQEPYEPKGQETAPAEPEEASEAVAEEAQTAAPEADAAEEVSAEAEPAEEAEEEAAEEEATSEEPAEEEKDAAETDSKPDEEDETEEGK